MITIEKNGVKKEIDPSMLADLLEAGWKEVKPETATNSQPLPKKGLNREQRSAISSVNRAQSLVVPSLVADAVKSGKLSTITAKVTDFLLKTSKNGGFYVACQVEINLDNNVLKFCILDDVDHPKLDVGNLITLEFETTDRPEIRSGVLAKVEKE